MLDSSAAVKTYFAKLGFEPEIADIYMSLYTDGPQTISSLSRNARIERTRIYRLIDKLMASNIIEVEMHGKHGIIKPAPIANLRIIINQREAELKNLTDELSLVEQALARNSLSNPAMQIHTYRGPEGWRRMLRNELTAATEICSYGNRVAQAIIGKPFVADWIQAKLTAAQQERLVVSASNNQLPEVSQYTDSLSTHVQSRVIDDNLFHIANPLAIYDNTIAFYHQKDGEVFGTEITCNEVAAMQRQLFALVWDKATTRSPNTEV